MGYIHILDDRVRELISAGEVVERPASVVKELVENALDAGATRIDIELRNHGLSMIQVTDNGKGFEPDDIPVAFMRHATSKIREADDLYAIGSLGFRGEALAAIAAVSRVRLTSKTPDRVTGYRYIIEGGKEISLEEYGTPTGSTVTVSDLFYNTPARMKFLKKDVAEGNACEQLIWHIALSEPDVSFRLIREGKLTLRTTGQGLYPAIFDLYPREIASSMIPVSISTSDGVAAEGYVSAPTQSRASRSLQHISVNGRYIRSRAIQAAAEEAYRGFIMQGKFPAFVLSVNVPLDAVDVNVHPAKTEIRFTDERSVTRAVYKAVRDAVQQAGRSTPEFTVSHAEAEQAEKAAPAEVSSASEPSAPYTGPAAPAPAEASAAQAPAVPALPPKQKTGFRDPARDIYDDLVRLDAEQDSGSRPRRTSVSALDIFPDDVPMPEAPPEQPAPVQQTLDDDAGGIPPLVKQDSLRIIGELFRTYILAETSDQLVFIDMHAAHERILYELIRDQHTTVDSQILLEPVVVSLSPDEKQALTDNTEALDRLGFQITEIGDREVAVREVPTYLKTSAAADAVTEIAQNLIGNREDLTFEARDWLMHSSACRAAIKAGHVATGNEMVELAEKILCGDIPKFCPHGRPVYFTLTKSEVEKRFGRIT